MADLDRERADLNALVREAHEAIKDMNHAMRQIDERLTRANQASIELLEVIKNIEDVAMDMLSKDVADALEAASEKQVRAYDQAWTEAVDKAQDAIFQRFDRIFESITGGVPSIPKFPSLADEIARNRP